MRGKDVCTIADQCFDPIFRHFFPKRFVKGFTDDGGPVQFEITGMDQSTRRRNDRQGAAFGYGVRDGNKRDIKGPSGDLVRPARRCTHHRFRQAIFGQFAPRNMGGKGAGIDGRTKLFPKMANSPHMVFMCMGDKDRLDLIAPLFQP